MTRDEIIKLAREARWGNVVSMPHVDALERFAALVAAAEREQCAKLCYEESRRCSTLAARSMLMEAAVAIRARSQA